MKFLYDLCCEEGHDKADPDLLVDMLFDKGGIHINRFGFAQDVPAPTDTGRPEVGRGPFVKRTEILPRRSPRYPTGSSLPSPPLPLAAPSDFDPRLIDRSAHAPIVDIL